MVSHEERNTVRLDVSNFGPIAEASVDLRPLTVFVGPSNTGKSYLATLTYALHRFFSGDSANSKLDPSSRRSSFRSSFVFGRPEVNQPDADRQLAVIANWIQSLSNAGALGTDPVALPNEVDSIVRRRIRARSDWNEVIPGEFARCFGTAGTNWLVRHGAPSSGAEFSLKWMHDSDEGQSVPLRFDFSLDKQGFRSSGALADSVRLSIESESATALPFQFRLVQSIPVEEDKHSFLLSFMADQIADSAGDLMVSPFSRLAYYLPTDRTGIMHAHRWVAESTISSAPFASLRSSPSSPSLSGVLADFLLQMMSLGNTESHKPQDSIDAQSVVDDFGAPIEEQMLWGKIRTDRSNPAYPTISYLPNGWKTELPLMNASSMVSELAPVVLYLRHVVKPGEVLIIEEPESNLHPAMQVEFMRQLAAVVNSGVRIMITTHSEWILDELANLVRLSDLPPEKRTPRLKNEPALDPRDVGVWLFERGKEDDGSRVKELPFDVNEGGFATGYEDTARLTYNQWAAIHNLLQK